MTQYIFHDTLFYQSWFTFDLILVCGWIIEFLYQLYPTATFDNCFNNFKRKRWSSFLIRKRHSIGSWKAQLVCLVPLQYTFHDNNDLVVCEAHAICRFLWVPIYYSDSHDISVEPSDYSASILRKWRFLWVVCYYHVTLAFQSESTL